MACVNPNDPEFRKILEEIKNPLLAEVVYKEKTNSLDEFGDNNVMYSLDNSIKPGVQELFESNPELASIGTQEQYSSYISTIFPNSVVKDIVYHGTNTAIESFNKSKIATNTLNYGFYGKGFYFNETKNDLIDWWKTLYKKEPNIVTVVINTKNPYIENSNTIEEKTKLGNKKETEEFTNDLLEKNYDSVLPQIPKEEGSNEYVVFEPEQIHILSSKSDIQGFKEFVNNTKQYSLSNIENTKAPVKELNTKILLNKLTLTVDNPLNNKCS